MAQLGATTAFAQATRTWVSGVGDDANPCSRTAPCKTFAGAISKTAAGGEINALDPGGFGAVTITKSINIVARGTVASVLVVGTNGITIAAAATDVVTLQGLEIEGINMSGSAGLSGVKIISAGFVQISDCKIRDMGTSGVEVAATTPVQVVVANTEIINSVRGIYMNSPTAASTAIITRSLLNQNNAFGILSAGANSTVQVSDTVITGGLHGFHTTMQGKLYTFGNNTLANTAANVTPTGTLPLQ